MRAWDETEEVLRQKAERRAADHDETLRELSEEGIDLDPAPPGSHRHGDVEHASDHEHPHAHAGPGERPVVGIVGAGAVGTALGVALDRAGWPVGAVASRDPGRRERFRALVPGARGFAEANALVDEVELVILAVPDDVVPSVAASLRLYAGQAMVHTSGLLGAEVLLPAHGGRDPGRRVPPAGRVRGPGPRARGAPRGDDRDRGRRGAGGPPRGDGRGHRRGAGPAGPRLEGGLSRRRRAVRRRRRGAAGHDPGGRRGRRASTRRARCGSSCRSWSRRSRTPAPWGSRPRSPGRPPAATPARSSPTSPRCGPGHPGRAAGLPGPARAVHRGRLRPGRAVTGSGRTSPDRTCREPLTRYDAGMQHSIVARHAAWPARFAHPSARARERRLGLRLGHRVRGRPRASHRAPPTRRRAADGASCPLARADGRAAAPRLQRSPAPRVRDAVDQLEPGRWPASVVRGARVARLKQAIATSAGGIVIRFEDGVPQLVVGQATARSRRGDLDPAQGHAQARRDHGADRRCARSSRRRASRSASSGPSTPSSTRSSRAERASTRPSTTS